MNFSMWTSSLGKKYRMAVTGLLLMLFLAVHLLGNLQIFLGADWLNGYAAHLEEWPLLTWPARVILLAILIVHLATAAQLATENKKARPVPYGAQNTVQATVASRTMVATGLCVFFFIIYHLLHYTWGVAHPQYFHYADAEGRHDVYSMVILSFRQWPIASTYLISLLILSFHVGHGASSFLQTLGLMPPRAERKMRFYGHLLGWLLFAGYASIPVCSWLGILKPAQGGV